MPGLGRTKYWWAEYENQRKLGYSKKESAAIASIVEDRHRAKMKRKHK